MTTGSIEKLAWLLGVGGLLLLLAAISLADPSQAEAITAEGGVVETLSCLLWLAGLAICIRALIHRRRAGRFWLIFWGLLCLVCFGEESSWLQHYIHYETPAFMSAINHQKEVNLHNLEIFHGGAWKDTVLSGRFDIKSLLSSQNLFRLGLVGYFLLIPLLAKARRPAALIRRLKIVLPGGLFIGAMWIPIAASLVWGLASAEESKSAIAEIRELFYALFVAAYLFIYLGGSLPGRSPDAKRAEPTS
jgi:hypothetical protein